MPAHRLQQGRVASRQRVQRPHPPGPNATPLADGRRRGPVGRRRRRGPVGRRCRRGPVGRRCRRGPVGRRCRARNPRAGVEPSGRRGTLGRRQVGRGGLGPTRRPLRRTRSVGRLGWGGGRAGRAVMSTCLCTATRDVGAGYVAPTSHVLTCSWVSGPRPSHMVILPSSYGCATPRHRHLAVALAVDFAVHNLLEYVCLRPECLLHRRDFPTIGVQISVQARTIGRCLTGPLWRFLKTCFGTGQKKGEQLQ